MPHMPNVQPNSFSGQPLPSIGANDNCYGPSYAAPQGPVDDESLIVDWPLSATAQEQIRAVQTRNQYVDRPRTQSRSSSAMHGPPTPMPPLNWDGYVDFSARPTFA